MIFFPTGARIPTHLRAHARHAHTYPPSHPRARACRTHRRAKPARARYIHSRHLRVPVIRKKYKSAGQSGEIVVHGAKAGPQKNPYLYSYVVRIFLYPKGNHMEISARVEKILEQYRRGLLTVTEARQEIMEILYADFMQNNVQS